MQSESTYVSNFDYKFGDDGRVAAVILQSGRKPEGDKQNNREEACDSSISRRCRKKFAFKIKGVDTSTESAQKLLALNEFLKAISLLVFSRDEEKTFSTMKAYI